MLGQFGLPESRVQAMSLPELAAFVRQADLIQRARRPLLPAAPIISAAPAPASVPAGPSDTTTYVSKRRKT
ncbi:hypothetical protein [Neisseria shayeganii]|uniref:Uncharacterized protein n=1 Tax=Neisseria shayeganii TaxID=607712 RepID=A0A7D7N6L6_9NEIS|nr:hypothetical protein [Neisseria shayeganii]QMT40001.1 hypothetical protein H3L94_09095 [Neisseria shayeganii]